MKPALAASSAEIPTSSMADIAFLLIIFFMVTSTLSVTRGLDLGLPEGTKERTISPVASILVEVHRDGFLTVNGHRQVLGTLFADIAPMLRSNPSKPVIVKTDHDAPYAAMVGVLDQLRQGPSILGLEQDIVIAIPTQREIESLW